MYTKIDVKPIKPKQLPRKIPLYKQASWDTMKEDMRNTLLKIKEQVKTGKNADELWNLFKNSLDSSIKVHIPHNMAKVKDNLPWISLDLKRLIKKRDRCYKTMKKSNNLTHKSKFKDLKRAVQRNLRRAYWSYIESISYINR